MNPSVIAQAIISTMNFLEVIARNTGQDVPDDFRHARSDLAQDLADEAQRLAEEDA